MTGRLETESRYKKLNIECISSYSLNFEVKEIVSIANENEIDLIVSGTKGAKGINKILFGSHTSQVMDNAHCPILAVPQFAEFKDIRKIAFATDFHDHDFDSVRFLNDIAFQFGAEIIVVHVAHKNHSLQYESNRLSEFTTELAKHTDIKNISSKIIAGDNIPERLDELIKDESIDIVAMATHKKKLFDKFFHKSLTKEMLYHTHIPLLAFHLEDNHY